MKTQLIANKFLPITFEYRTCKNEEDDGKRVVTFFLPVSFIESGDLDGWKLEPDNFLGVNLKVVLEAIREVE